MLDKIQQKLEWFAVVEHLYKTEYNMKQLQQLDMTYYVRWHNPLVALMKFSASHQMNQNRVEFRSHQIKDWTKLTHN